MSGCSRIRRFTDTPCRCSTTVKTEKQRLMTSTFPRPIQNFKRIDSAMYPKFSLPCKAILHSTLTLLVLAGICAPVTAQTAEEKPNIVLINLDDADAELLSDETLSIRFPNLEALANKGLRFTNTHSTSPLCGPSRACLLRGQYAHNTNIFINLSLIHI